MNSKIVESDIKRIISSNIYWSNIANKSVLITGATGFIGSFLVFSILERNKNFNENTKVIAMVRNLQKAESIFSDYLKSEDLLIFESGLLEEIKCDFSVDYIIHCASNAAPDKYQSDPVGTMQTNLIGTDNLLKFAKDKKVQKFVYISTIEVYGKSSNPDSIGEDDYGYISSTNARACYPESKKCAELLSFCYGSQFNIPVCIARLSYVYGAGMDKNDSKVCAYFARSVANKEDIILKSKGLQKRSYTYVTDIISGILQILAKGEAGQAYNISSANSIISISDFAEMHCKLFDEVGVKVQYDLPTDTEKKGFSFIENAIMSSSKLENIGWKPEVSLEDGIKYSVHYFMGQ